MTRRELDVPATPRSGGGRTEPKQPELGGDGDEEGLGNIVTRDKTLLETPERGKGGAVSLNAKAKGKNGKNKKKRAA
jgi:hypothetical protein